MKSSDLICPSCGAPATPQEAQFCWHCGVHLSSPTSPLVAAPAQQNSTSSTISDGYSVAFINMMRLLAASCMFSGMYAAWAYDVAGMPGRALVVFSVGVALLGMLFVQQASKKTPPTWVTAVLALFWVGVVGLVALWSATRFT